MEGIRMELLRDLSVLVMVLYFIGMYCYLGFLVYRGLLVVPCFWRAVLSFVLALMIVVFVIMIWFWVPVFLLIEWEAYGAVSVAVLTFLIYWISRRREK